MNDIIGYGGSKSGGSQHAHYEATDSLHSTSYARVLDLVSEGEILGLASGMESVYLNQTPLQNPDGSLNFKDTTVDFRSGTQSQDYIAGFPDVENEVAVGSELRFGTPWTHAINNISLSAVRITLAVPALSKADTTNGDINGYNIDYQIELSKDGGSYAVALSNSFNGKTTTLYQRTARIDLPPASTGWSIRVTRLTTNANTIAIADTTTVISYTEVIDAKLRYPMSALVGLQVDAKQFQSVPTRSYDLYGRIIQVPSNYDPIARTYADIWDGTFKPAWTSNPAWVFRDLVLNDRYGLGNRITAAQIDKWSLYAIGQYCDQMVPNGKGGTEPRFTCNVYIQSQKAAYAVLQDLASVFRGISYWGGGNIIASSDRPSDPVYVYTAANVVGGKFSRVGTSKKTRYTVAMVSWNDPTDFYRAKVEYVEDPDGIKRYGIQQVSLTAFGCTSQGQAQRAGRWALTTSRLETDVISFDVGMDGAIALPGQIVRIADPSRMGRRNGGRVRAAVGRVVTLDKAPTINAGDQLTIILPSGTSETRTVASVSGDSVTMGSDWSTLPVAQSVWSVDNSDLIAPTFKILAVTEKPEGNIFSITATQHEPGKYDYVENNTAIVSHPVTALDSSKQSPPTSVAIAAYTVTLKDSQKLAMSVSCAPVPNAVAYEGAYKRDAGNWIPLARQSGATFDVIDVLPGTYLAKMSAVNSIGITSVETLSAPTAITTDGNSRNAAVILTPSAPAFHTDTGGTTTPGSIVFTATLIALDGPAAFSVVGGTLTSITATTATLTFANMSAASATVTASISAGTNTYSAPCTITKMQDGAAGTPAQQTGVTRLFQWSPVTPSAPTGTSTFTWSTAANSAYTGSDGWSVTVPSNPGTPGLHLYVVEKTLSALASATTSTVSYAGTTPQAWAQNGANGANGVQSGSARVYLWAVTIPSAPTGTGSYTWAGASYAAPTSTPTWTLSSQSGANANSPGYTLWAATVALTDSSASATTAFNWGAQSTVTAIGYAGTNGTNGSNGSNGSNGGNGASYRAAYSASATASTSTTPAATSGNSSFPAANDGGISGTWGGTVPALSSGQFLYQSDGIYNPATNQTTWSIPYWSSLKVGSLSAITANLGTVTAGTINGLLIQTATSGKRVAINESSANSVRIYDIAGTLVGEFGGSGGAPLVTQAGTSIPAIQATCASSSTAAILASASAGNAVLAQSSGSGAGLSASSSSSGPGIAVSGSGSSNAINITGGANSIVITGSGGCYMTTLLSAVDGSYSLGNASFRWNNVYATSGVVNTSDARTKTAIRDTPLGLDFIMKLRGVAYKMIVAENIVTFAPGPDIVYPGANEGDPPIVVPGEPIRTITPRAGQRDHYGLISQEVRTAMLACGVQDAAFWTQADPADPNSLQALRYDGFIAPLIKAIQEVTTRLAVLETKSSGVAP